MPTCARPRPVLGAQATPIQRPLPGSCFPVGDTGGRKVTTERQTGSSVCIKCYEGKEAVKAGRGCPVGVSHASQDSCRTGARVGRAGAAGAGAQEAAAGGLEAERARQEGGPLERGRRRSRAVLVLNMKRSSGGFEQGGL